MSVFFHVSLVLFSYLPFGFYSPEAERLKGRLNEQLCFVESVLAAEGLRERRLDPQDLVCGEEDPPNLLRWGFVEAAKKWNCRGKSDMMLLKSACCERGKWWALADPSSHQA